MADPFDAFVDDLLENGEPQQAAPPVEPTRLAGQVRLTTLSSIAGRSIVEAKGIVSGYCVLGTSGLPSLKAAVSDALGTRSNVLEARMRAIEKECFRQMRFTAAEKQCDAVVDVSFRVGELSGESDLIFGQAIGTAVVLSSTNDTAR